MHDFQVKPTDDGTIAQSSSSDSVREANQKALQYVANTDEVRFCYDGIIRHGRPCFAQLTYFMKLDITVLQKPTSASLFYAGAQKIVKGLLFACLG